MVGRKVGRFASISFPLLSRESRSGATFQIIPLSSPTPSPPPPPAPCPRPSSSPPCPIVHLPLLLLLVFSATSTSSALLLSDHQIYSPFINVKGNPRNIISIII